MQVSIDEEVCIGCGLCVENCPEVFSMQDDKAIVYVHMVPGDVIQACKKAKQECPVDAIN